MYKFRLTKFLFVTLLCILSFNKAEASHFGAADLWVTYIGDATHPLRYAIHLGVYRACEASQALLGSPDGVTVSSSCTAGSTFVTMDTISGHGSDTLDQLCPNFKSLNSCRQPTSIYPGFNRFNYYAEIDLPQRCSDWKFVWSNSARNAGILNLCQPASSYAITIDCHINNQFSNESSPRFTVDPIPYLCINQPDQFFNGPYDPNGDSLYVENVQPLGCGFTPCPVGCGPNTEIPYNITTPPGGVPYSLTNPIQSLPAPYVVDPATGIATFTPSLVGKFVLAFKVSKYDPVSKVFLGSTRRDVQVSILSCNAPPPAIDSVPSNISGGLFEHTPGNNIIYACPNSPLQFTMNASSKSGSNVVYLSVDTGFSKTYGATFNVPNNGSQSVNGTFTWTPGDTSLGLHTLVFSAVDSTCNAQQPIVLKNYLVVTIKVVSGIHAIPKLYRNCPLSATPVTLNVVGLPASFTYNWINATTNSDADITNPHSANPSVLPPDTTMYIVSVPGLPSSCKTVDTVTVNVDTSNHIKITPSTPVIFCQKGTLHLTATPNGNQPTSNLSCGVPLGAVDTTSRDSTVVVPSLGSYAGFTNANNSCSPFTGNGSAHHQYLLLASDMLNSGMISGTLTGLSLSVNQITTATSYSNVVISLMCTKANQLNSDGTLIAGGMPVYTSATPVTINAAGFLNFVFNTPYNWDTTQNLILDICYSNTNTTATPPNFDYYYSGYPSSSFVYNDTGNVCNGATFATGGYPLFELPVIRFNYYDAPTVPFPYAWQTVYGSNMFSDSTAQSPVTYINQSSRFYVISRGKSGCSFRDSVDVYLDPVRHPYILPGDTTVCANVGVQLNASFALNGYAWYQNGLNPTTGLSCNNCQTPIATLDTTTNFTVVFTDTVKCVDTAYAKVNVIPYPVFKIITGDTNIKYGSSIMLAVSSGNQYHYVWNPPFTLDNPYLYNPTATPLVPTVYSVIAYNQFCPGYDTVKVGIDYRSPIFVPSAFTPNNDGKNDVFRVANITFQRVIEFRVFNRWGQQIYTATDNKGWDGTWDGRLMDMGVYSYIIRVVYPDGVEDNFTGNVTLIR